MNKPEKVEEGQWWRLTYSEMKEPVRLESTDIYGTMPVGVFYGGWSSASLILTKGEYLGSGDHPEPSAWMIETLAALSARMTEEERGDLPGSFYLNASEEQRECVRGDIRWYLDDKSVDHWACPNHARATKACIREVYSILRELGKW